MSYADMSKCELSRWSGDERACRWCNKQLQGRQRAWCSKAHMRAFRLNHYYTKARAECVRRYSKPCGCVGVRKHVVCARCGRCSGKIAVYGYKMECNHISPRNGDKSSISCLHHQDNLEMLCWECHQVCSAEQRHVRKTQGITCIGAIRDKAKTKPKPKPRAKRCLPKKRICGRQLKG